MPAWALIRVDDVEGHSERYIELGYDKHKGRWALLVREGMDPTDTTTSFLLDASREMKLQAVERLPNLIAAVRTEATKLEKEIIASANRLKEQLENIGS